jgi:hypothetical protein
MAGRPHGNTFWIYSEVLSKICQKYLNNSFSFNDLETLDSEYTISLHRKLLAKGLLIKVSDEVKHVKLATGNWSRIHQYQYKLGSEIKVWYDKNYLTCNGHGKIAKSNRERMKLENVKEPCRSTTTTFSEYSELDMFYCDEPVKYDRHLGRNHSNILV